MTRWSGVVGVEGKLAVDGRYIEPGALTLPKGPVALIAHSGQKLVGNADTFERDGGYIRASGELHEDIGRPQTITMFLAQATVDKGTGHITAGEIRAVYVGDYQGAWPECVLDA